jgi:hypothetical protein
MTPTATNPDTTPTATPTPTVEGTPITVTAYSAFAMYNEFTEEWTVTIFVALSANVNTSTAIDATINVAGGQQTFALTVPFGSSSATANNGYLFDPEPVSPNCLTFIAGDTRVTTAGYTCP